MSQSSVKFGKKRVFPVGTINFMTITAEVATSKFDRIVVPHADGRLVVGGDSVANSYTGSQRLFITTP